MDKQRTIKQHMKERRKEETKGGIIIYCELYTQSEPKMPKGLIYAYKTKCKGAERVG